MAIADLTLADRDLRARRNLRVLVTAQVVLGSQLPVSFILGGLSGQYLATNKALATLPVTLTLVGSMLTAPALSALMQRRGRRLGFVLGSAGGAAGAALCALALMQGSFALFLLGAPLIGVFQAAQNFFRFAATDGASENFRPRAISWVMGAGLANAIIGPQLVKATQDALAPVPFAGAYLAVVALNLLGVGIFAWLDSPPPRPPEPGGPQPRNYWQLVRTPRIAVAMLCSMISYALMTFVMTSSPLAVVGCGYSTGNAADVVGAHVLAMFAPSFFTGMLIARFGAERVIAIGLAILAAAGAVGVSGLGLGHFFVGLMLLGCGWNFGFIGATALLTASHRPEERGRVQGMNDFAVFALVALGSLASGGLMNHWEGNPVAGWHAVNLAMVPALAVAAASLAWLALRPRGVTSVP